MEVNAIRLEEVARYGYCSLQHRLQQQGLPWFPASYEAAVSLVVRRSLSEWFRCQMIPSLSKQADTKAYLVFKAGVDEARRHFKPTLSQSRSHSTDFMLGVLQVAKAFDPKRDSVVGFDVPSEVPVPVGDRIVKVSGTVDVIYRYMADTDGEHFVLGTNVGVDDPTEDLVRYGSLRKGFAIALLRQASFFNRSKPVRFFTIPVLRGRVKTRWEFERITPADVKDFESIVASAVRGIEAEVALPTGHPERCDHCPYKTVCSPSLSTSDLASARAIVQREAISNPFWSDK